MYLQQPKNFKISSRIKCSAIIIIYRSPFGSIAVDDKGIGLGGLFEVKNNQYSISRALTLVPAATKIFEIPPPPLNFLTNMIIQHLPCGPVAVDDEGKGLGHFFG